MNSRMEAPLTQRGKTADKQPTPIVPESALARELQWNSLLGQQDLLREEINRGKECLKMARTELAESQSRLEEWPAYERQCGVHCLPGLTGAAWANKRVERFLTGWLSRRQEQLAVVNEAIERFAQASVERQPAELAPSRPPARREQCQAAALRAAA